MSEFVTEIHHRIRTAQQSLDEARAADDDYLVGIRTGELESLTRLASEHGVDVPALVDLRQDTSAQVPADTGHASGNLAP